jgi:hypothetical protein
MNLTTIADYEAQFRVAPIGHWTEASGTFSNILNQQWEFKPDYRGKLLEMGIFGDVRSEMVFEWREVAPFTIACKVKYWHVLHYRFLPLRTDVGETIVMVQMSDDRTPKTGFWWSLQPLMLRSLI